MRLITPYEDVAYFEEKVRKAQETLERVALKSLEPNYIQFYTIPELKAKLKRLKKQLYEIKAAYAEYEGNRPNLYEERIY